MIEIGILKLTSSVPYGSFDDETIIMTESRIFIRDLIVFFSPFKMSEIQRNRYFSITGYFKLIFDYALRLMCEIKKKKKNKKEKWKWLKYTIKLFKE